MGWRIKWTKEEAGLARIDGKSLTAYAYNGPGGRMELHEPCDDRQACLSFLMAQRLHEGLSLDDAVKAVKRTVAEFEAKQEQRRQDLGLPKEEAQGDGS